MASPTKKIKEILQAKNRTITRKDILEIIESDICGYAIVALVSSAQEKFGGRYVAARFVRGQAAGDDEKDVQEAVLTQLHDLSHAEVKELVFVDASESAREFILSN